MRHLKLNETCHWRAYCRTNLCPDWVGEEGRKMNVPVRKNVQCVAVTNKFGKMK